MICVPQRAPRSVVALLLAAGSLSSVAHGQTWNAATSGLWFDATHWNPNAVPSGAGAVGTLGLSGAYDVTTTTNTIAGVNMTNPQVRLLVAGNSQLVLTGTSTVNGQLIVNGNADYATTTLTIGGPVQMNGTGQLLLNCSPSDPGTSANTSVINAAGGGTLTLGSGFLLGGFGYVNTVPISNNGTVSANVAGRPFIVSGGDHTNNGLLTAIGGNTLTISGASVTQTALGQVAPQAGGAVLFDSTPLTGGSITSSPTGRVRVSGNTTMGGSTINGGLDVVGGATVNLAPSGLTLSNATLTLNVGADYAGTSLRAGSPNTPINGTGTIRLNCSTSDPGVTAGTSYLAEDGGDPLGSFTFAPGVTLAGFGWINSVPTTNNGVFAADTDGRPLRIDGSVHQNNNLYTATGGGTLQLYSVTLNQAPGAVVSASGSGSSGPSNVQLNSCTVTGGSLSSSGAAQVHLTGATGLTLVSTSGQIDVEPGANVFFGGTGVTLNNSTLMVNPSSGYAGTSLRTGLPFTFSGTGSVRLQASTSDPAATAGTAYLAEDGGDAGGSFIFQPGVTLSGFGWVTDVPTTNNSTFSADVNGYPLRIQGNTHANNGTYRAINGGQLVLVSTTINQGSGAQITAGNGSAVYLSGSVINGGTLGSPAGGTGLVSMDGSNQQLNSVTVSRQLTLAGGGALITPALTLSNAAEITINTDAGYAGTALIANGTPTVLGGAGTVHLRASTSDPATTAGTSDLRRDVNVPDAGLTIGAGISIDGTGQVSDCPTTNYGVVYANQPGRPIRFTNNTHQNNGTYRAVNGGRLVFAGTTVTQAAGASMLLDDGTELHISGVDFSGGSITGAGSARCTMDGNSTLHGLTLGIPVDAPGGGTLTIGSPGVTANGPISVNNNNAYAGTYLSIDGVSTTIDGNGGVRLMRSTSDTDAAAGTANLIGSAGSSLVLGPSQSLTGSGRVVLPVTVNGTFSPGLNPGNMDVMRIESEGSVTMGQTGQFAVDIQSGSAFDHVVNNGAFHAAGTVKVAAQPGFVNTPAATYDVVTGGTVDGGFSHVVSQGLNPPLRFGVRIDPGRVRVTVLCGLADIGGVGADANGDGHLDNNDFIVFIDRFFARDPLVDFGSAGGVQGSDGNFDNNDFIAFIDLFFAGCF